MSSSAALAIFAILAFLLSVAFIFAAIHIAGKASAGESQKVPKAVAPRRNAAPERDGGD